MTGGEAEAWLKRNETVLPPRKDPVGTVISLHSIIPDNVLEIGCSNGWRLDELSEKYGCNVFGIDPKESKLPWITTGTAEKLPYKDGTFDLVIYGFCLYLVDRDDLFKVVMEGDRVLADGGHLIIHDFSPEYPHKRPYEHCEGVYSYKMNYENLWLANPSYRMIYSTRHGSDNDDYESVCMLKKDVGGGWPIND